MERVDVYEGRNNDVVQKEKTVPIVSLFPSLPWKLEKELPGIKAFASTHC